MGIKYSNQRSISRLIERIDLIIRQEQEIKSELAEIVKRDTELSKKIELLTSIPGIGKLTAVIILAETNGFELIRNKKQLVSYAGLDVKEKTSGISVKGKPRISKRGNRHVRKAMHLPSLAAIRTDSRFRRYRVPGSKAWNKNEGYSSYTKKAVRTIVRRMEK